MLMSLLLSACAVGPDFKVPPAPTGAGYTPEGHAAATVASDSTGGLSQRFDVGRDIPGQWWTVFHSKELDGLIVEALQANPSLEAAQAALWQAKENLYAQRGKLLPSLSANGSATREQFSPAEFGESGSPFIFNLFEATVNVSYAPDVWGGQRRRRSPSTSASNSKRLI
jgi:outer membrane protein TolC